MPDDATFFVSSSRTGRGRYHHGNLRAALVVSGLELLEESGIEALSLRAVAARTGVSHTAPKNHFASMRALWTALATEGFWRLGKALKDANRGNGPRQEKLRSVSRAYVQFALSQPGLFQLMFSPTRSDRTDPDLMEAEAAAEMVLSEVALGLDWPRNHAPYGHQRTEWMIWSYLHGYAMLAISGRLQSDEVGRPVHDVLKVMPDFNYAR
ncbi:MAG: WHG domain-containing protein [Pseudomonadota bacterium]